MTKLVRGYPAVLAALERAYQEVRDRRIVLATHMHAGDGNVHVNVPVLSNDRPMLERTDQVIDRVMEKVISLGGVVSGEHGIGLTKLKYLEPERIAELTAYRREVDPGRVDESRQAGGFRGAAATSSRLPSTCWNWKRAFFSTVSSKSSRARLRIASAAASARWIAASIIRHAACSTIRATRISPSAH